MHAAWVVLLCATARAARVATPTKDDRIQATADAAGTQRIFTEQCLRDRSQTTCEDHCARWVALSMRQRLSIRISALFTSPRTAITAFFTDLFRTCPERLPRVGNCRRSLWMAIRQRVLTTGPLSLTYN